MTSTISTSATASMSGRGRVIHGTKGSDSAKDHAPREDFVVRDSMLTLIWKRGQRAADSSIAIFAKYSPHYHTLGDMAILKRE